MRPQNNQVTLQRINLALRSLLKTEGGEPLVLKNKRGGTTVVSTVVGSN